MTKVEIQLILAIMWYLVRVLSMFTSSVGPAGAPSPDLS